MRGSANYEEAPPRQTGFLDFLPPAEVLSLPRIREYADSLDPLIVDLQQNLADRENEFRAELTPIFHIDFSELHYLWASHQTLHGRVGNIDWKSMLMDAILTSGRVTVILPPGAVCEIALQLGRDLNTTSLFPTDVQRTLLDPTRGVTELPEIGSLLRWLPSQEDLLAALASRAARARVANPEAYSKLHTFISKGHIRLLHATTRAADVRWNQPAFAAAYVELKKRPKSTEAANVWDAVTIAVCSSLNSQSRRSHERVYLVARGRGVADAARVVPGAGDANSRARNAGAGFVRSPVYLHLYANFFREVSVDRLMSVGEMVSDLDQVRRAYALSCVPAANSSTGYGLPRTPHTVHDGPKQTLVGRVQRFRSSYAQVSKPLYAAWETHRKSRTEPFLPFDIFANVDAEPVDISKTAVTSLVTRAEQAKAFITRLVEDGRPDAAPDVELSLKTAATQLEARSVVHAALFVADLTSPAVFIDFVDDYFTCWWNSNLTVHEFLDWIERFAIAMSYVEAPTRERDFNWSYSLVVRDKHTGEICRESQALDEFAGPDDVVDVRFPLSVEARAEMLQDFDRAEAFRYYTAFGDLWMNSSYDEAGSLRTGLISHVSQPAFLAAFIGDTCSVRLPTRRLFEHLQELMNRYLGNTAVQISRRAFDALPRIIMIGAVSKISPPVEMT